MPGIEHTYILAHTRNTKLIIDMCMVHKILINLGMCQQVGHSNATGWRNVPKGQSSYVSVLN